MGAFEPVVCQAGWYCPTSELGRKTFKCPSGSYCQPGAATPTPCSFGSHCPEGSSFETFLIPVVLLILIDVALLAGVFFTAIRNKFRGSARAHISSLGERKSTGGKGLSGVTARITGYKALEDEADHEMVPMDATYMPGADGWSGFQAVLDMQAASEGAAARNRIADDDLSPQLRTFVESMRRATDATDFGLSFGYQGLACKPKGAPRPILQNVTGSIPRGSLVAVMGGSGAGKSTFVNVLMGKTAHTGGAVTVNGQPSKVSRFKKLIGYVPQDDIVLPELTVYENIAHAANVRLPRTWSARERQAHVDAVIECLELSHVRDSLVGTVSKPVISGGQRKRVSIGMELAAAPMAMFLDEPTSGLDATAANSIMRTLQALARLGISVIVIIHQPRMEIFEILDNVILLADGQIIYEGAQDDIETYFESAGFHFPDHSNHADVLADIVTGNGRLYKRSGDVSKASLISYWAGRAAAANDKDPGPATKSSRFSIISRDRSTGKVLRTRGAPLWRQLWLCLNRALLQQYRAKGTFASEMALALLAGFLLGLAENSKSGVLFVGLYNKPYDVLSLSADFKSAPEMALLVAIAIGLVAAAPGVRVFSEELLLHKREAEAGHSRIAYFLAKVISPFPRMVMACSHFTVPLFLLSVPIMPWGLAFAGNLLYFYCIYGLAGCITMLIKREDAPLFATMISLIVGILSGAAPPLAKVKEWHLEWLWRASPGVWLAEMYFAHLVEPFRYLYDVDLAAQETGFHLHWLMRNNGVLAAIGTVYRILAFIGLVYAHRLRR